jgi:hypothetical protein
VVIFGRGDWRGGAEHGYRGRPVVLVEQATGRKAERRSCRGDMNPQCVRPRRELESEAAASIVLVEEKGEDGAPELQVAAMPKAVGGAPEE